MGQLSTTTVDNAPGHSSTHNELARLHNVLDGSTKTSDAAQTAAIAAAAVETVNAGEHSHYGALMASGIINQSDRRNALSAGIFSIGSGDIYLVFFRSPLSFNVGSIRMVTTGSASPTPSLVKLGIYSIPAVGGDLTLIGATGSDPSLFAASDTIYTKALLAPTALTRGNWYVTATLIVSSTAVPRFACSAVTLSSPGSLLIGSSPRLSGFLGGQTDLPASITAVSVGDLLIAPWAELIP